MMQKRNIGTEKTFIIAWLTINLILGLLIVDDYGIGYDEPNIYRYAESSVDAYQSLFATRYEPEYGPSNLRYYGPSFILAVEILIRIFRLFGVDFIEVNVWHYAYFILFQFTGLCLYGLARRWFSMWVSAVGMILFITQPLFWGHAFINPKDIPFMFFFTLSILVGFRLTDSLEGQPSGVSLDDGIKWFQSAWQIAYRERKRYFLIGLAVIFSGALFMIVFADFLIEQGIHYFYLAENNSWSARFFHSFAEHASRIPVEDYVFRAQAIFTQIESLVIFLAIVTLFLYLIFLLTDHSENSSFRWWFFQAISKLIRQSILNVQSGAKLSNLLNSLHQWIGKIKSPPVILAGCVMGLTTSIRVLGPLAGLIVILAILTKDRKKSSPLIFAYLFWAGVVIYLTWPYLWLAPLNRYLESLSLMSKFAWDGLVLFDGKFYLANNLPRNYLPVLINIQITESALMLIYLGVIIVLWQLFRKKIQAELLVYLGLGSFLPLFALLIIHPPMYDNFRQILFIFPGLFVISLFALQVLFEKIQQNWQRLVALVILILPSLASLVQLHPYQYIYYNAVIGGPGNAFRRYEIDYWQTSMRELASDLNESADPGARIGVIIAPEFLLSEARPDLKVERLNLSEEGNQEFDYAVLTSRWNGDQRFPDAEVIFAVERRGAILGVIKHIRGEELK